MHKQELLNMLEKHQESMMALSDHLDEVMRSEKYSQKHKDNVRIQVMNKKTEIISAFNQDMKAYIDQAKAEYAEAETKRREEHSTSGHQQRILTALSILEKAGELYTSEDLKALIEPLENDPLAITAIQNLVKKLDLGPDSSMNLLEKTALSPAMVSRANIAVLDGIRQLGVKYMTGYDPAQDPFTGMLFTAPPLGVKFLLPLLDDQLQAVPSMELYERGFLKMVW